MMDEKWIMCPVCGSKTRSRMRSDTILKNFPLFCPKCKAQTLIDADKMIITVVTEPDAKTQSL